MADIHAEVFKAVTLRLAANVAIDRTQVGCGGLKHMVIVSIDLVASASEQNERVNRFAHDLIDAGARSEFIVGVRLERPEA